MLNHLDSINGQNVSMSMHPFSNRNNLLWSVPMCSGLFLESWRISHSQPANPSTCSGKEIKRNEGTMSARRGVIDRIHLQCRESCSCIRMAARNTDVKSKATYTPGLQRLRDSHGSTLSPLGFWPRSGQFG